jgi:hypothetical protein
MEVYLYQQKNIEIISVEKFKMESINESKSEDFVRFSVYKDVVYHGTWKSFDKFRISTRGSYGKGFYFTSSEMSAYKYGNIIKNV